MKNNSVVGKEFLRDLKLYSDYLKWKDESFRYETWEEACEDIIDGHKNFYENDNLNSYLETTLHQMKERRVLASQRTLQYRHGQLLKHHARVYNCTSLYICRERSFQEAFYLGLCGCGVGWGLLLPFVNNLSEIEIPTNGSKLHVVEDSIEGWADALGVLLSSFFKENQPFPEYYGYQVKFDFSKIREQGSYISGGFKAPGPSGLKQSLENIENLLVSWIKREGSKIRPILAFDILCFASNAVLSGGVRRSAANAIVDPNDKEMIFAKTGNWFDVNPQRARSNNSVLLVRSNTLKEEFVEIFNLNNGMNDIGFVFANSYFDMFNPCYEILKVPMLVSCDFSKIKYENVEEFIRQNKHLCGVQGCNLSEINGESISSEDDFFKAVEAATVLGTLQAGYTSFPYLGEVSEKIFKRESLLGVSITGWMNNPWLFENPDALSRAASHAKDVNKNVSDIININPAARVTTVKPSGNASVVLCTSSGANPDPSSMFFRLMQINKESDVAKYVKDNHPILLEESVWSDTNSDYVMYIPIKGPDNGFYKDTVKDINHLEKILYIQNNWVKPGTREESCVYPGINHNTSCTVIVSPQMRNKVCEFIWDNKDNFTALSFASEDIDKDYKQAPFTSVLSLEKINQKYGDGGLFASGLIVDGLHYFGDDLWEACSYVLDKDKEITGNKEQVLLKKYWIQRAKKFSKNYFKNDHLQMTYCLKDVHLYHKWITIQRDFKSFNLKDVLPMPQYRDISNFAAMACNGTTCDITKI